MERTPLISLRNVSRRWGTGSAAQLGLDDVDVTIGRAELVAITGPSGSGKSTLGAIVAGIDQPTSGSVVIDGHRIDQLRNAELARWRGRSVGIVFQNFHLLPTLTAVENVELALTFTAGRVGRRERRRRATDALAEVGLAAKAKRLPGQLSGGEQQRVAIARAVVTRPLLVVADEATGSLDQAAGHAVVGLLREQADRGTTVLLITHDTTIAEAADRRVEMLDGRVDRHTAAGVDLLLTPHAHGTPVPGTDARTPSLAGAVR